MKSPIEQYAEVEAMKKVDVLGIMRDIESSEMRDWWSSHPARVDMRRAIDAVAELIHAYRSIQSCVAEGIMPDTQAWDYLDSAFDRIA